jgi:hypothetical protein
MWEGALPAPEFQVLISLGTAVWGGLIAISLPPAERRDEQSISSAMNHESNKVAAGEGAL